MEASENVIQIRKWFAHSHHDDMANPFFFRKQSLEPQHLFQDFTGRQVSIDAIEATGAENTTHRATHLTAYTDGSPFAVTKQNTFNSSTIGPLHEQFFGSILRL